MFLRRRAPAAPRPPLSSVWWPESGGGVLPPLPASDPFGGHPAFPSEPADFIGTNPPGPATHRPPTGPLPVVPPAPMPPAPGLGGPVPAPVPRDEWLPLLTHEHQRFQLDLEEYRPGPPSASTDGSPGPRAPIDPMAAAGLAGAFAADYLSWDETGPLRRGQVLAQYLAADRRGHVSAISLRGWSGTGRQRADFAVPGAVRPGAAGRVTVEVRVRITPYRAVGSTADPAQLDAGDLERADGPAVAPAPTARGWKSLDSMWVRLTVPVLLDGDQLVVDLDDHVLNGSGEPAVTDSTAGGASSTAPDDEPEVRPPTPADFAAARARRSGGAGSLTEGAR